MRACVCACVCVCLCPMLLNLTRLSLAAVVFSRVRAKLHQQTGGHVQGHGALPRDDDQFQRGVCFPPSESISFPLSPPSSPYTCIFLFSLSPFPILFLYPFAYINAVLARNLHVSAYPTSVLLTCTHSQMPRHQVSSGIDLSVSVLTMGYWPTYTAMEVVLPPQVHVHVHLQLGFYDMVFREVYKNKLMY